MVEQIVTAHAHQLATIKKERAQVDDGPDEEPGDQEKNIMCIGNKREAKDKATESREYSSGQIKQRMNHPETRDMDDSVYDGTSERRADKGGNKYV